jgi:hypothetical protein
MNDVNFNCYEKEKNDVISWPRMDDHNEQVAISLKADKDFLLHQIDLYKKEIKELKKELKKERRRFCKFRFQQKQENKLCATIS